MMGTLKSTRGFSGSSIPDEGPIPKKDGWNKDIKDGEEGKQNGSWGYKSVIVLILVGLSRHRYCYLM